jgi:hypothetical protein
MEEDKVTSTCNMYVSDEKLYRILVRKPEGKKPLGRPDHR